MSICLPEEIYPSQALSTPMIVNVFFGSKKSKVEMRHLPDGQWQEMERVDGIDPYYADMKLAELGPTPPNGMPLPGPSVTDHLWRSFLPPVLPPGTHMFEVRTTDMHGKVYTDRESIRVLPYPAPQASPAPPTSPAPPAAKK